MHRLNSIISNPEHRQALVADCEATLEKEVNSKRGVIAFAVKKTFQLIRKLENGQIISNVFEKLLDEFVEAIEPFEVSHESSSETHTFSEYLIARAPEVSEALLVVTDRERDRVGNPVLVSAYTSLRSPAQKLVIGSVPALAEMLERHKRQQF